MKKVVFLVSHLGSGSFNLLRILNKDPNCHFHTSEVAYKHPDDLKWIYENHKLKDYSSAIYGDHLLYNTLFYCKPLYKFCKFIYVMRSPRQTLNEILISNFDNNQNKCINYYKFRIRRIFEMARETKGAVFTTFEDLSKFSSFSIIENYLKLSKPLDKDNFDQNNLNNFNENLIKDAENYYNKYFYLMNNLDLRKV
jgi:hypothetical protein